MVEDTIQLRDKPTGRHQYLLWFAVVIFIGVSCWSLLPPSPVGALDPDDRFSSERAFEHVRVIAKEPHPMGTAAIAEVRAYITAELEKLGIEVEFQSLTVPDFYGSGEPVRVVNIIGRIPGKESTKAVALMGHYDTVPTTSGANDNSVAVATLLETGRAIRTDPPLRNDVYLLFTDGEEPAPRHGSNAFVNAHSAHGSLGLVVNFEASGGLGPSMLAETSGPQQWLVEELAAADPHPAAFSFLTATTRWLGDIGTDFDPFRNAGVTGLHFVYLPGFSYLFAWPALAASAALCWREGESRGLPRLRFALVAAPTLILMTPAIDVFFQMAQPRPGNVHSEMPAAAALSLMLMLLAAALLRIAWPQGPDADSMGSRKNRSRSPAVPSISKMGRAI